MGRETEGMLTGGKVVAAAVAASGKDETDRVATDAAGTTAADGGMASSRAMGASGLVTGAASEATDCEDTSAVGKDTGCPAATAAAASAAATRAWVVETVAAVGLDAGMVGTDVRSAGCVGSALSSCAATADWRLGGARAAWVCGGGGGDMGKLVPDGAAGVEGEGSGMEAEPVEALDVSGVTLGVPESLGVMEPDLARLAAMGGGRARLDDFGVIEMGGGGAIPAAFSKSST